MAQPFTDLILALPNLRFAYPLDAAGTADVGPNSLTLTANGSPGTTSPGPVLDDDATSFNGTDQSMSRAHNAAFNFGTGDYTIGLFVNPSSTSGTKFLMAHHGNGDTGTWEMRMVNAQLASRVGDGGSPTDVSTGSVMTTGWQFVAFVADRDGLGRWWRNDDWAHAGTSIASQSGVSVDFSGTLWIARRQSTGWFAGSLAWAFGCASALSEAQLDALYAARDDAAPADVTVIPGTASLTTTLFIPTVTTTDHQLVIPTTASLATTLFAPTVTATDHKTVTPGTASLTLTAFAPTVTVTEDVFVTPGTAELATTAYAPTVSVTDHQTVVPGTAALTLATFAPTVSATADVTVTPDPAALAITTFAPTVSTSDSVTVIPGTASHSLTAFAPTVVLTDHQTVTPSPASLSMTAFAPDVVITDHQVVVPGVASLVLTGYAPMVVVPTADISDAVALLEAAPMPVASLAGAVHPRASLSSAPMPHVTEVS